MTEERRQSSIDVVLTTLGKLEQITSNTEKNVVDLNIKVGIQNGRIGKIETEKAFFQGICYAGMGLLTLIIVPLFIEYLKQKLLK